MPVMTKESYEKSRANYLAKHGSVIHIPNFEQIFKWERAQEPTYMEVSLEKRAKSHAASEKYYISKIGQDRYDYIYNHETDPDAQFTIEEYEAYNKANTHFRQKTSFIKLIGEYRYDYIKRLRAYKREKFLHMLESPTSNIAKNAASIMTMLDDVNDTLGTLGVVARVAAHRLPGTLARSLAASGGNWLFTGAQIAGLALDLSRLPLKAFKLQHELHGAAAYNPLSRKARLRRIRKMMRKGITKGEFIEAAQTTDNLLGIGLCLGPIMGLITDIWFGLYRHAKGEKVVVRGLPRALYGFDRVWSNMLKTAASVWTGIYDVDDKMLGKSMVDVNMCFNFMTQFAEKQSILDMLPDVSNIEIQARTPTNPLTIDVIQEEVTNLEDYVGWPENNRKWIPSKEWWDQHRHTMVKNLADWWTRNNKDQEAMVCSQNAVEAAMTGLGLVEGEDAVEVGFDATSQALMDGLNQGYRFPENATAEQSDCFAQEMAIYDKLNLDPRPDESQDPESETYSYFEPPIEPNFIEAQGIARDRCGFEFTVKIPTRYPDWYLPKERDAGKGIERLRQWYFWTWMHMLFTIWSRCRCRSSPAWDVNLNEYSEKVEWLKVYGYPIGQPAAAFSRCSSWMIADGNFCVPNFAARVYAFYDPYPAMKEGILGPRLRTLKERAAWLKNQLNNEILSDAERRGYTYELDHLRGEIEDIDKTWTLNSIPWYFDGYAPELRERMEVIWAITGREGPMGEPHNWWAQFFMWPQEYWPAGWNFRKMWRPGFDIHTQIPTLG